MNNRDKNGESLPKDYIIHPAFSFGQIELSGFWIAKFVSSQTGNQIVQIKSEETMWLGEKISTIFDSCYLMASDPHYQFVGLEWEILI